MKYIKPLNESTGSEIIKGSKTATKFGTASIKAEWNDNYMYLQQVGHNTVSQVALDKTQAAELIEKLQEFLK